MTERAEFDLVCIGGGLAGLVGAARASELGLRVIVLEREDNERYRCNSRYSAGVFHACYMDVTLPPAELKFAMSRATAGYADEALLSSVADNAGRAFDWLRDKGSRFVRDLQRRWVMAPPRSMKTGVEWDGRGPDVVLRLLTKSLREHGGRIELGTRARELIARDGRYWGVVADRGGTTTEFNARAVLIADGGFQANAELYRQNIGPCPDRIIQRNAGNGLGDGLAMAAAAGAALTGLDRFYGHLLSADAFTNPDLWPFPQIDGVAAAGIVVDREGRRMFDEGLGGIYLANMLGAHLDPLCATVVCDSAIWESAGREHQIPPNPLLEKHGGRLLRADTIEGLATAIGIPAHGLSETVRTYNEAVAASRLQTLAPQRTPGKSPPRSIVQSPFVAIPICAGITNTMGGPRIDPYGCVMGTSGEAIWGLYCAGAALGGLEGGPHAGYVGGLVKSVFGLRAAEHLAGWAPH